MSRKKTFISNVTIAEIAQLEEGKKHGKSDAFRTRCQAILLSNKGYTTTEISAVLSVSRSSVFTWFSAWKKHGFEGLKTKPGQGRKALLSTDNQDHVKAVEMAVKKSNEKGVNLLAEVDAQLGLNEGLSMRMLRAFLKKKVTSGNGLEDIL